VEYLSGARPPVQPLSSSFLALVLFGLFAVLVSFLTTAQAGPRQDDPVGGTARLHVDGQDTVRMATVAVKVAQLSHLKDDFA
jgi:hypothetical protein